MEADALNLALLDFFRAQCREFGIVLLGLDRKSQIRRWVPTPAAARVLMKCASCSLRKLSSEEVGSSRIRTLRSGSQAARAISIIWRCGKAKADIALPASMPLSGKIA